MRDLRLFSAEDMTSPLCTRRDFLARCAGGAVGMAVGLELLRGADNGHLPTAAASSGTYLPVRKARFYETLSLKRVKCTLCPRECIVDDKERGYCGVRENRGGVYYTLVHSNPCAANVDPIEKKPLHHFFPGTKAFSIATAGCNMECAYCQNWQISQARPENTRNVKMTPAEVVALAKSHGCNSIAFTYTEPVVFLEYVIDTSIAARKAGVKSVMITAGYINPTPLKEACRHLDAIKVDFKGFSEKFYREVCHGELAPVLKALKIIRQTGTWLELVVLVVPGRNDDPAELRSMCRWVVTNLGRDTPIAFTRFHPMYKLKNIAATPVTTLEQARRIATEEGLRYAYVGNVPGHRWESTYCPQCGKVVIRRIGYSVDLSNFRKGACGSCGKPIPGIWK